MKLIHVFGFFIIVLMLVSCISNNTSAFSTKYLLWTTSEFDDVETSPIEYGESFIYMSGTYYISYYYDVINYDYIISLISNTDLVETEVVFDDTYHLDTGAYCNLVKMTDTDVVVFYIDQSESGADVLKCNWVGIRNSQLTVGASPNTVVSVTDWDNVYFDCKQYGSNCAVIYTAAGGLYYRNTYARSGYNMTGWNGYTIASPGASGCSNSRPQFYLNSDADKAFILFTSDNMNVYLIKYEYQTKSSTTVGKNGVNQYDQLFLKVDSSNYIIAFNSYSYEAQLGSSVTVTNLSTSIGYDFSYSYVIGTDKFIYNNDDGYYKVIHNPTTNVISIDWFADSGPDFPFMAYDIEGENPERIYYSYGGAVYSASISDSPPWTEVHSMTVNFNTGNWTEAHSLNGTFGTNITGNWTTTASMNGGFYTPSTVTPGEIAISLSAYVYIIILLLPIIVLGYYMGPVGGVGGGVMVFIGILFLSGSLFMGVIMILGCLNLIVGLKDRV